MTLSKVTPLQTIGIIGGGQLGKMMAQSALRMGFKVAVLDPSIDAPARSTSTTFIHASFDDEDKLKELCQISDVVTYEFENIHAQLLASLVDTYNIPQGAKTVQILQNRETEKAAIKASGAKIVPFERVKSIEDIEGFIQVHQYPVIIKTSTGGYDGKGQYLIENNNDLSALTIDFSHPHIIEKYINLHTEVSLTVARRPSGQTIFFNLQENTHKNQVLYRTIAPARINYFEAAKAEVEKILHDLHFVGSFTVEFFIDESGELYVNEIAPRPHNSAHYTIEACNISQFDAHILSILDLPMPQVEQYQDAIMMNLLGDDVLRIGEQLYTEHWWFVHMYGKSELKSARKMGHITVLTEDINETIQSLVPYFGEVK